MFNVQNCFASHYEFSKEVEEDLIQFKRVVKSIQPDKESTICKSLLLKNTDVQVQDDDHEIVEVSNQDENIKTEETSDVNMSLMNQTIAGGDTKNVISEILISKNETEFSDEFIKRLEWKCRKNNFLFEELVQNLCDNTTYNLGNALLNSKRSTTNIICLYFKDVLLFKMFQVECSNQTMALTNLYLSKHWNDLQNIIVEELYKLDGNVTNNLKHLSEDHKRNILRHFVLNLKKLLPNHLEIIMILLPKTDIDNDVITKLLEHLVLVASIFNENKQFGKLIVTIIKLIDKNNLRNYMDQLKYITNEHKTFWKGQSLKLLQ